MASPRLSPGSLSRLGDTVLPALMKSIAVRVGPGRFNEADCLCSAPISATPIIAVTMSDATRFFITAHPSRVFRRARSLRPPSSDVPTPFHRYRLDLFVPVLHGLNKPVDRKERDLPSFQP
jgi:hypothetical protein